MPYLLDQFKHGGAQYPLTTDTTNSLLLDADPALAWSLSFFTSVLNTYVKPRLLSQSLLEDLKFPSAVESAIHSEPSPWLLSDDVSFPVFCLYRKEGEWEIVNASKAQSKSTWEWAYILPPMTPRQVKELHPILRSVEVTMCSFALASFDKAFEGGKTLRDLSSIKKMWPGRVEYGNYEKVDNTAKWWRAITGQIVVLEQDELVIEETEPFEGANASIDLAAKDVQTVPDFVQFKTQPKPIIETVSPNAGTKAGSQPFNLYGEHFKPGSTTKVLIGGAYAANVVVVHPTKIVGLTPAHDAAPTFAGDVQIIGPDGQASNVLTGAYTFTTP